MFKTIVPFLFFIVCFGCSSKKPAVTADDFLSDVLNHPTKFEATECGSRYWNYNQYLVHFVSNINDENKKTAPFIYVHGLGGSLEDFSEVIKAIHSGKLDRSFYAIDLPAFGKSLSHNSEISIRKYSEMLREFVHMLDVPKVNLVCHSMGGQVCIDFALGHPDMIQLLTLISPAGVYQKSDYINQTLDHYVGIGVGSIDYPNAKSLGDLSWFNQEFVRKMITNDSVALIAIDSFRDNFHKRIHELRTKTLILWGRNDTVFSYENGLYLKENIEDSTLYIIEGADHFPLKTHAAYISKLILQYL